MKQSTVPTATVREVHHHVRINLHNYPAFADILGRKRKPKGLRIDYTTTGRSERVDVVVEYTNEALLFPPAAPRPGWLQALVEEHRPDALDDVSSAR